MEERIQMPLIGDKAPAFKAVTTQGEISFPEDYKGKWVILFSHPADFTPVCTTEFMTFASMMDEFREINTELIGLSVDSLYSHIAWLRKIQELLRIHRLSGPYSSLTLKALSVRYSTTLSPPAGISRKSRESCLPSRRQIAITSQPLLTGSLEMIPSYRRQAAAGLQKRGWKPRTVTCTALTGSSASGKRNRPL